MTHNAACINNAASAYIDNWDASFAARDVDAVRRMVEGFDYINDAAAHYAPIWLAEGIVLCACADSPSASQNAVSA